MARQVYGNTEGLSRERLKKLEKLYRKRIPPKLIISPELSKKIMDMSLSVKRQIGLIVDRSGHIEYVVLGDRKSIELPDLTRRRISPQRLLGLRYIHTHLDGEPISQEDVTDLLFLRFDLMAVLKPSIQGHPPQLSLAYISPSPKGREVVIEGEKPVYDWEDFDAELHVKSIEDELRKSFFGKGGKSSPRAILVGVGSRKKEMEDSLKELEALARTCGIKVVGKFYHHESRINPKYLVGMGKLKELTISSLDLGADMIIFDRNLLSVQAHSISDITGLKVIDRTQLILDIFAQGARTREAKIQVELAQLKYLYPRLIHRGTAMSRLMGGIGGRGPGETKLEMDRRKLKDRINRLEKELTEIAKERRLRRKKRKSSNIPLVSIVGYTNAGKSTLFNNLTNSSVFVEDRLFATLEPTTRKLCYQTGESIIVTDTVGFINRLPKELVRAFRATLEELFDADFLIHIVDVSDGEWEKKLLYVREFLREMGISGVEIVVFNKLDLLSDLGIVLPYIKKYDAFPLVAKNRENVRSFALYLKERVFGEGVGRIRHWC